MCLSLMASCCENDIVPQVLPFVEQHLQNPDWKFRDAAVMALGVCVCVCVCVRVCVCACMCVRARTCTCMYACVLHTYCISAFIFSCPGSILEGPEPNTMKPFVHQVRF